MDQKIDETLINTCVWKNEKFSNMCDLIYGECQFKNKIDGCSFKAALSDSDGKIIDGESRGDSILS